MLRLAPEKASIYHLPSDALGKIFEYLEAKDACTLAQTSKKYRFEYFKAHERLFDHYYHSKTLKDFLITVPNFELRYTQRAILLAQRHLYSSPSALEVRGIETIARHEQARNLISLFKAITPYMPEEVILPELIADDLEYADTIRHWMEMHAALLSLITEHFDISNRSLTAIPSEISYLKNIRTLDASDNALMGIPLDLCDCSQLRYLLLNNNIIESLPSAIGRLLHLRQINLSRNKLRYLPTSLGFLPELTHLDLSSNHLTVLPQSFTHLRNLATLNLELNYLAALPEDFDRLSHCSSLSIRSNKLERLPEKFGYLPNLIHLELSHNRIVEIPRSIGHMTSLRKLDLSENKLFTLPKELASIDTLKNLNLSMNQIQFLPEEVWLMAVRVNHFRIFGNPFVFGIPPEIKELLDSRPFTATDISTVAKSLF